MTIEQAANDVAIHVRQLAEQNGIDPRAILAAVRSRLARSRAKVRASDQPGYVERRGRKAIADGSVRLWCEIPGAVRDRLMALAERRGVTIDAMIVALVPRLSDAELRPLLAAPTQPRKVSWSVRVPHEVASTIAAIAARGVGSRAVLRAIAHVAARG